MNVDRNSIDLRSGCFGCGFAHVSFCNFRLIKFSSVFNDPVLLLHLNIIYEPGPCSKGSDQPVHTHSLIRAFASRLNIL